MAIVDYVIRVLFFLFCLALIGIQAVMAQEAGVPLDRHFFWMIPLLFGSLYVCFVRPKPKIPMATIVDMRSLDTTGNPYRH